MSNYSKAEASNRGTKAEMMMDSQSDLERQLLAREQEKRDAQSSAYRNAIMGDAAVNWMPARRPQGTANISFVNPSMNARAAGATLFDQAMARMNAPDLQNQSGMPAYRDLTKDKEFQNTMKPGIMERITGIGGMVAPLAGALAKPTQNGLGSATQAVLGSKPTAGISPLGTPSAPPSLNAQSTQAGSDLRDKYWGNGDPLQGRMDGIVANGAGAQSIPPFETAEQMRARLYGNGDPLNGRKQ
jgi:hypothetical protein